MNTFRTLTAVGAVALAAAMLTPGSATAAPPPAYPGKVTVDRQASLGTDTVTLTGTYTCSTTAPAALYTQVATRSYIGSATRIDITCDGRTHTWTTTGPREEVDHGAATALVNFELCYWSGDCPRELFEAPISLTGRG